MTRFPVTAGIILHTFERPVDGTDPPVPTYPGVHDEHGTGEVVLPQAVRHAFSEEGGYDRVGAEGVVGGQHVVLSVRDVQHNLSKRTE